MIPLTDEEKYSYNKSRYCNICRNKFNNNTDNKEYQKVRGLDHYTGKYRGAAHRKCNLEYKVPKEIPVVFHNGSKYDYHFIIRELAKGIDGMECLVEDAEKYITFKVPLRKENKDGKLITYKLKFIDSIRFMNSSLSDLADNLSEIHNQTCKKCDKKYKGYTRKNDTLIYRCKKCNNKSYKSIVPLKENFPNVYNFCNGNIDKFLLLLRKGVYPYDYMDGWGRFNEEILPPIIEFYNKLNQKGITDEDYKHAHKVWDTFRIKNLGEYHDLYVQSDTLQLGDIFENFRKTCQKIDQLDPSHFVSAPNLAWQACLKKTKVKLEL